MCNSYVKKLKPTGENSAFFKKNKIAGGGYREAICPVCGSFDRERMEYYFLKKYTTIFSSKCSVLHFAPETGLKEKLQENKKCDYITGDITPGRADYVVDITNIQFTDEMFDFIICNHVLEHIPDEAKAISELKRVLKPNGRLILTMPISLNNESTLEDDQVITKLDRRNIYGQADHVRLYGKDVKEHLKKLGLKVKEYELEKIEGKDLATKLSIHRGDRLYYCKK
jgi:SAM-dependent methyltransferase